jgi:serine/threonine protein phosphatase 1
LGHDQELAARRGAMIRRLSSWLGAASPAPATPLAPVAPEGPACVIGDIHGRADLLARALQQRRGQTVCLGDYIDRGPDSAAVLRALAARPEVICLMGNHEEMLLSFLDAPARAGPRWLQFGGAQTVESFGIPVPSDITDPDALQDLAARFRVALGPDLEAWLRALPSYWQSGNLAVTHAGADPALPMDQQSLKSLRWGHPKFGVSARRDGLWVLRGHVIYDDPLIEGGVISIDTGAWRTGRLTCAHIEDGEIRFSEA